MSGLTVSLIALTFLAGPYAPTRSNQFGAQRDDFSLDGAKGFVILPTRPAVDDSHPWVWYAPTFIGSLPDDSHEWMAKQLLAAGFAICGVDVGESYGGPNGTKTYSTFYRHVVKEYRLDRKACLLPQSRGGLMLLNWAVENPRKVQCIAGIYTVCNLESYPGIEKCAPAYNLKPATLKRKLSKHNPIDRTKSLARSKVPLLFIHGDSDKVVPIEQNAGELVNRCKNQGGVADIIVVQGKGHEVCNEFFQSRPFIDFILANGQRIRGK
jgi:dipeptidyl aminopeptidase/acylaminoacyl peptidase